MRLVLAVIITSVFLAHTPSLLIEWDLKKQLDSEWEIHHKQMASLQKQ